MRPLPTIHLPTVYHVGSLNPADKRPNSYEGAGLSVSIHPDEWRQIARGSVSGDCWRLDKPDALFLDAHALGRIRRRQILTWAENAGLATPAFLWRWTYWDDELDGDVTFTFGSLKAARHEREDSRSGTIRRSHGHRSTEKLLALTLQDRPSFDVLGLVLPLWTREVAKLDGVWWSDRLDPACYSAPRGVIDSQDLCRWIKTPAV